MDPLTRQISERAESAVEKLQARAPDELDFSEASLTAIEALLAEVSDLVPEMPDQHVTNLVQLVGCYVLEVGRRAFGGQYFWLQERDQPVLVVGEPEYRVAIITFDKVRGRANGDEADNIPFFFDGFAERARNADPGTDTLYV